MKRFLLGALGTLCLAGQLMAQPPMQPTMPRADTAAPDVMRSQPAPVVLENGNGNGDRGFSLVGGFDFLSLRPHFTNNPALTIFQLQTFVLPNNGAQPPVANTNANTRTTVREFEYDFTGAPRGWIGLQNENGLGIRGRWFRYEGSDATFARGSNTGDTGPAGRINTNNTFVGGATFIPNVNGVQTQGGSTNTQGGITTNIPLNDPLIATSSLDITTWDAEITQALQSGCWQFTFGAGGRYAFIEQNYSSTHPGTFVIASTGGVPTTRTFFAESAAVRHTFTGGGPLLSLETLRRLGESKVALYGNARGSILFGRGSEVRTGQGVSQAETLDANGVITAVTRIDRAGTQTQRGLDILPILELEAGVQWATCWGNLEFMLRPAVVSQTYFDGGNSSTKSGSDFGLIGFMVSAGLKF